MTLGQEFAAFATHLRHAREALAAVRPDLCTISLGATAIGTGIAADPGYAAAARRHLAQITDLPLVTADDLVGATTDMGAFLQLSGGLKRYACTSC